MIKAKKKRGTKLVDNPLTFGKSSGFLLDMRLVMLADFIFSIGWHKHEAFGEEFTLHGIETLPAFYGLYGFFACVGWFFQVDEGLEWKEDFDERRIIGT